MTKYKMCYEMDKANYRHLPWVNLLMSTLTKSELLQEYENFIKNGRIK